MAWLAVRHPEVTSHPSSIATHLSGGRPESVSEPESSSDVSDALSQILMLPEPRPSKKRKPALTSRAVTITDCEILDGMKAREEEKAKKEAEKQAQKVEREQKKKERAADKAKKDAEKQARKVEWEQKKEDQEADKAARKNEVRKRKEAREAAKEAIKGKGHSKDRGNIENAIEKLTLSKLSDSESDHSVAQCPKCGLTFQEDGSNSVWVCCDGCQAWLDFKCTSLPDPDDLPEVYFCTTCVL